MKDHLPVPYRNQWEVVRRAPVIAPAIIAAVGVAAGSAAAIAITVAVNVIVGLAISLVTGFLMSLFAPKGPRLPEIKRELRREQSLPLKRFVYGEVLAPGSPAPWKVKGNFLYGCLILNSRPSAGGSVSIQIDGRAVTLNNTANITDFSATGGAVCVPAAAPFAGYARFWLGLGDQAGPPDEILSEASDIFQATDAWNGLTVLWCALNAGPTSNRAQRWPSVPPQIDVSMKYSKVWDPRDPAQSLSDPSTWTWSANQALCCLDAHTQNPLQKYTQADLDIDQWKTAAAVADEEISLAAGGTEPRYEVNGIVVFNASELASLLDPLFEAGAADRLVVGGRTSIVPGVYQTPAVTISDVIGDGINYETLQPGRSISNSIAVTYTNRDRNEDAAELPPFSVPGAITEDGGVPVVQRVELTMVTSPTQAARVQRIVAYRQRGQKRIECVLPPDYFDVSAGTGMAVDFPSPLIALNDSYQAVEIQPQFSVDGDAVAMTLNASLREDRPDWYVWDTTMEPDIPAAEPIVSGVNDLEAPATLTVSSSSFTSGQSTITRALLEWPPVDSNVSGYETQFRDVGGNWQQGPSVDAEVRDGSGDVFAFIGPLEVGEDYDFRVRAVGAGRVSEFTEATGVTITAPAPALPAPTDGTASATGTSTILTEFRIPNDPGARGLSVYSGTSADTLAMSSIVTVYGAPSQLVLYTDFNLDPSTTYYYAARTIDEFDAEGVFSAVVNATTQAL